jgi:hypothetical protein
MNNMKEFSKSKLRTESYAVQSMAYWFKPHFEPRSTAPWEISWMLAKHGGRDGNICETGVFVGETTREFASFFPQKTIYAVDVPPEKVGPPYCDHGIFKTVGQMGLARGYANVQLHAVGVENFIVKPEYDIQFVFIDDDHTYEGVKRTTEKFFNYFRPAGRYGQHGIERPGTIVWHDAYWHDHKDTAVLEYLEKEASEFMPVKLVLGTCLAYCDF